MSAVNIFETPEGAMIFTDAAMYDAEGVLVGLTTKCRVTASGLAVTGRGNAVFPDIVAKALDRYGWSIDEVEEFGEAFLEKGFAALEQKFLAAAGKAFNNVWIVGWSERDGRAKIVQWANCPPAGVPRFKVADNVLAPNPSAEGFRRIQAAMAGTDPRRPDFARMGLAVMKSQRLDQGSAEFFAEGKYLVGGHILRTEVTRDGITQTIVHEWPEDTIGERIRPTAEFDPIAAPNVTPITGMSRQQRRRAEKLAKKGRAA